MKKKLLVALLALCLALVPLTSFAEDADLRELFADGSFEYSDSLYENNEISTGARVTFEYAQSEQAANENAPEIGCKAAYVADPITGKVFYEKNAHDKMYPASTTKILTALMVLENCQMDDVAVVSPTAAALVDEGLSNAGLLAGEEQSVYTLLQALLIPSANEAAYALAEHVSGSIEAFAELSNSRAKELGCENLHFINPNGLHDDNHYCSAYDLYLIARECQKYDVFNEIVKTKSFTVPASNVYAKNDRTFDNTNELLANGSYYCPYCTGIKTGHTTPAGECLVASASKDNINLVSVVLGGSVTDAGNDRFLDTKKLFEYVYDNYSFTLIADSAQPVDRVNVINAVTEQEALELVIESDIYAVAPAGITDEATAPTVEIEPEIKAPVAKGQVLGTATYKIDGLNYSTNIVAANDVEKKPFWLWNTLVALGVLIIILFTVFVVRKTKSKKA